MTCDKVAHLQTILKLFSASVGILYKGSPIEFDRGQVTQPDKSSPGWYELRVIESFSTESVIWRLLGATFANEEVD